MYLHEEKSILTPGGQLRPEFHKLATLFGVDTTGTIRETAERFQRRFVTPRTDRWNEPAVTLSTVKRWYAFRLLRKLGLLDTVTPPSSVHRIDEILILGGIFSGCEQKFEAANALGEHSRIGSVAHLGSDRKLETDELDSLQKLGIDTSDCRTESDMMRLLSQHTTWSVGFQGTIHHDVSASATVGHRAHTGDTLEEYLRVRQPTEGATLVVVMLNPHVGFQSAQVARYLQIHRPDLQIHVVAPLARQGSQDLSLLMGAVARWLIRWTEAAEHLGTPVFV